MINNKLQEDWKFEFNQRFTFGGTTGIVALKTDNAGEIKAFISQLLSDTEKRVREDYDKEIMKIIDKYMKHIDDGIYDFREPNSIFLADNIKNDLKNIKIKDLLETIQPEMEKAVKDALKPLEEIEFGEPEGIDGLLKGVPDGK